MCLALPVEDSTKLLITFPKTMSDLLILQPSLNLSPLLWLVLSEPAKSIKWNCLTLVFITPFF
jgi:hypothetical protein